jgi:hypothetical protein
MTQRIKLKRDISKRKKMSKNEFEQIRNELLTETNFIVNIAVEYTAMGWELPKKYKDIIIYREKLRKMHEQPGFDYNDESTYEWPAYPEY